MLHAFKLTLPEFTIDGDQTEKFEIKRYTDYGDPHLHLCMESDEPIPFAKLETVVSFALTRPNGNVEFSMSAPINAGNAQCDMSEAEYRIQQELEFKIWDVTHCRKLDTPEVYQTEVCAWASMPWHEIPISWWKDYELVLSIENVDPRLIGARAHIELRDGWK